MRFKGVIFFVLLFIFVSVFFGCAGVDSGQNAASENRLSDSEVIALIHEVVDDNLMDGIDMSDISFEDGTVTVRYDIPANILLSRTVEAWAESYYVLAVTYPIINLEELDSYWDEIAIEFTGFGTVRFTRDDLTENGHSFEIPPIDFGQREVPEDPLSDSEIVELLNATMEEVLAAEGYVSNLSFDNITNVFFGDRRITVNIEISEDTLEEYNSIEGTAYNYCTGITYLTLNNKKLDPYWDEIVIEFADLGTFRFTRDDLDESGRIPEALATDFWQ